MDLKKMYYFTRVANHLSFSKAAEDCHIAQTAMSRYIASLEEELGFSLFIRSPHKVELTAAGEYYLAECIQILNAADRAQNIGSQISEGMDESITIGFGGYEISLAKRYAKAFLKANPRCSLVMQEYSYDQLLSALLMEKCDVIFSPAIRVERVSSIRHKVLSKARYSVLCGSHEPFFHKDKLSPDDLEGKVFVSSTMDGSNGVQLQVFRDSCSSMGFNAGKLVFTNSVLAAISMIELSSCLCLVSTEYTENLGPNVRNIIIDCNKPLRKTHTVAYREDDPKHVTQLFMDMI